MISIIIPTLNEAPNIVATLASLQPLRSAGHQVIVADGGSQDSTVALTNTLTDRVIASARGRAAQMNSGARVAGGDILLFLHADTRLPSAADDLIRQGLQQTGAGWGRFDVRLSGPHPLLRIVERMMNWRSRLTGIATGDQAIFVRREWFDAVGGFPDIRLMEDIVISHRLKKLGPPLCLKSFVVTSSCRWEEHGILRTILLMWWLRLLFFAGVRPDWLVSRYYKP